MLFIVQWSWTTFINIIYSMELSHNGLSKWSLFFLIHASLIIIIVRKCKSRDHLTSSSTNFLICICIWYVVEPNYGFYTTGRDSADGGLYWRWFLRAVLNASKEFACTTLFDRWFQWITVSTKKECWYCCFL
jgi:hypothetical protein